MLNIPHPCTQLPRRSDMYRGRMSKDEASRRAYEDLPKENVQQHSGMSNLHSADEFVLLSFEALPSIGVSCSFLSNHEAKAASC